MIPKENDDPRAATTKSEKRSKSNKGGELEQNLASESHEIQQQLQRTVHEGNRHVNAAGKPSDVYVVLRVSSMIGNEGSAHVHPFVDRSQAAHDRRAVFHSRELPRLLRLNAARSCCHSI